MPYLQYLISVQKVTYEGQASIELESLITNNIADNDNNINNIDSYNPIIFNNDNDDSYEYLIFNKDKELIIDTVPIINSIVNDLKTGTSKSIISQRFHNTVISFSVDICKRLRELHRIDVALSGGVFQNSYIFVGLVGALEKQGFKVYTHSISNK